jgi:hypothetical protein
VLHTSEAKSGLHKDYHSILILLVPGTLSKSAPSETISLIPKYSMIAT